MASVAPASAYPLVWLLLAGLSTVAPAQQTVTLSATRDATLYETSLGDLANGSGEWLFAGLTAPANGAARRALLRFDVAAALPVGAAVLDARLTLDMDRTIAGSVTIALHRLLADWSEGPSNPPNQEGAGATASAGDVTWLHRSYPGSVWSAPGGDFVTAASAAALVAGAGSYSWSSTAMVDDVQGWIEEPASEAGWILVGEESPGPATVKRFQSRTGSAPPRLEVTFVEPAAIPTLGPWAAALAGLLLATVAVARLRNGEGPGLRSGVAGAVPDLEIRMERAPQEESP